PAPRTTSYTLSLHDALPICRMRKAELGVNLADEPCCQQRPVELVEGLEEPSGVAERESPRSAPLGEGASPPTVATAALSPSRTLDRKSTRLNSSHVKISYAV